MISPSKTASDMHAKLDRSCDVDASQDPQLVIARAIMTRRKAALPALAK